jgi:hypothetical protein
VPSSAGSASTAGACRTSASGSNASSLRGRVDEHRLREQRVVRPVGDHAHRDAMGGVGAGERVDDVQGSAPRGERPPSRAARRSAPPRAAG